MTLLSSPLKLKNWYKICLKLLSKINRDHFEKGGHFQRSLGNRSDLSKRPTFEVINPEWLIFRSELFFAATYFRSEPFSKWSFSSVFKWHVRSRNDLFRNGSFSRWSISKWLFCEQFSMWPISEWLILRRDLFVVRNYLRNQYRL